MRVLFAITKGEIGGAQEHVKLLAIGLLSSGYEVGLAVREPSELATALRSAGASVFPWQSIERNFDPLADRRARSELAQIVRHWSPQILHLNSSKAGVLGVRLLRPPDGVTIFTCHHAPFGPGRQISHRVVARPTMGFVLPRFDGIISDGDRDVPALRRIAANVPIRIVANGIAPPALPDADGPLRPVALWVARMARPKDPMLLLRAWPAVVDRVPGAKLLMCGTGPLGERVRHAVGESPVGRSVEYVGFADDLSEYRAQASVFVLATRVEGGLTMATLESMANGLVPVVSDAGDAHLLDDLDIGIRVKDRSPGAFGDAVAGLFTDPQRYNRLRANALTYARTDRTTVQVVEDTVHFYREVLAANKVEV
jgi:glycosyltransferase involved in cell wall biosynthesis